MDKLEADMLAMWNFLYESAANFENVYPDGAAFIAKLSGIDDFDLEDDITPIADVVMAEDSGYTPGKLFTAGRQIDKATSSE